MRTPSLRRRVTLAAVAVLTVVLLVLDVFVFFRMKAQLEETLDDVLQTRVDIVETVWEELPAEGLAARLAELGIPALVHTPDGREYRAEPAAPRFGQGGVPTTLPFPRVERTTVLSDELRVTVFATRAGVDSALRRLVIIEALGTAAALLLATALLWVVSGASLDPLREVVTTARRIAAGGSGERLRPDRDDTELGRLAVAFDDMLDSLEAAISDAQTSEERTKRFLADAAHQLRTPLAGIRASVETLLREDDQQARDQLMGNLVRETGRAGRLLTSLLRMARLEQERPPARVPVDLLEVVGVELERAADLAPDLDIRVVADVASTLAEIDPSLAREALANLLDNARRHAQAQITVRLTRDDDHVSIRVEDDGPGIPEGADDLIFERFATLDGRGGSGLGLPIARAAARTHGGDLVHRNGGFELTLSTTRAGPAAPS
ncbi:MAG: HAMP domain-containing histidine kinase [Actinobacteria bacterium]|nr:HAMP domain-containing histidine kinase [Actinomycetota bacterium]